MRNWITFDLDGTLMQNPFVDHVFPEIKRRVLLENDKLEDVIGQLVAEHTARMKDGRTAAAYDWDDIVRHYVKAHGLNTEIDVEEILTGFCNEPNSYLLEDSICKVLVELRAAGFSLAVVTNGFRKYQLPVMNELKLTEHFDVIVTPEEAGFAKPDVSVFGSVLKLGQIEAHIGDRIDHDIVSANEIHIRSVWICRHLPDSLKRLSPTDRKGPAVHELVLRKLEKEMKKTIETLPEGAVPQVVIHSISELPSVLT